MSPFYSTYAGMLDYMSREFEGMARTDDQHAAQLRRNAEILAHMAAELDSGRPANPRQPALFEHPV
ncbi:hypothetical protein EDC65_1546 [Stella humosa]|uniref:Uncharacterized protein n=1 Tax=Stella humosa TaxID=94 RepID=A0A3N1MAI2_9PROT|nr:hypothetical protein [Stella humosa]ROP99759.1 hypothetical protein EDC65_1546 [Stella humosa]BBK31014.1 hypothetical protein STHU_16480 [Stella humosa]